MIVWGGAIESDPAVVVQTGDRYDPITDEWREIPTAGAPSAREGFPWVWTGTRLVVWGGEGGSGMLNTGGLFDPRQSIWSATPIDGNTPSPRGASHTAVWTGTEMLIWGGADDNWTALDDGGRLSLFTEPGEVASLRFLGYKETLQWDGQVASFGLDATFDLLRGDLRTLPVGGPSEACLLGPGHSAGSAADPENPTANHGWYYVARARNDCVIGAYGWATDLSERIASIECPVVP